MPDNAKKGEGLGILTKISYLLRGSHLRSSDKNHKNPFLKEAGSLVLDGFIGFNKF